jgi:hypothetical protein
MTIALGVMCDGGAVIGVDLEYTQDWMSSPGQKIFWLPKHLDSRYFVLIGAAGNPDSAKEFMTYLEEQLDERFPTHIASPKELKTTIRDSLKHIWFEHIDSAPANERRGLACDFLIALRVETSVYLFRTNRTMMISVKDWACLGAGLYLANYLVDRVLPRHPTTELAAQVVAHVIAAAKEHVQFVGKGSDIHILPRIGLSHGLGWAEREKVEAGFIQLFGAFRSLIGCADPADASDDLLNSRLASFRSVIEQLRSEQAGRVEARVIRTQALEDLIRHQPTTADPLRPQPSPESPGESDVS